MDRFEGMSIFVATVETGSLTAASRRLNVPLPSVSRKLAELESHLGTRLLARSTRNLTLTDAGADYFQSCKRILDEVANAERMAAGEQSVPKGELVLTAPIVFGRLHVLPVVNDFLCRYPDIRIRMSLSDRNAHLLEDNIDVAVRIGALTDHSMMATRLGEVRTVVCGSPAYFEQHGVPNSPGDLVGRPCVSFYAWGPATSWTFGQGTKRRERAVEVRPRLSVNTAEAALDAAMAGVGITRVLSYQAARAVREGLLHVVLEAFEPEPRPVFLLYQGQGTLPLKMRTFLDFAAPRLRSRIKEASLTPMRRSKEPQDSG
ncbi:LysR family transcriptional regulator [Mesorhizobium sp. CN2-181]|uniref:LysR family transcriptional regulator n=1 Tax=Mesorhizobium yinganensis TaxID=3157707 RepID=UPI0032B85E3A